MLDTLSSVLSGTMYIKKTQWNAVYMMSRLGCPGRPYY